LTFAGDTTPADLVLQLQFLAAQITDPGYRPEAELSARRQLEPYYARLATDPSGPLKIKVPRLLAAGDPRFGLPRPEEASSRTLAELRAWLTPQLTAGPIELSLVGDLDPETTIAAVAATLGALPPRAPKPTHDELRRIELAPAGEQALAYARRAVELAPENAVNVLSLAICYGKMGIYGDTRAKIGYSRLVKIEAERAAALDPNYDWAQHVLGRWHYEVADLGVAKRFFVRLIYGGLPAASFEEAIRRLERAVALAPNRVPHHLELGFAFLAAGRVADARASFARGLALPSTELYDESSKQRAREALARF